MQFFPMLQLPADKTASAADFIAPGKGRGEAATPFERLIAKATGHDEPHALFDHEEAAAKAREAFDGIRKKVGAAETFTLDGENLAKAKAEALSAAARKAAKGSADSSALGEDGVAGLLSSPMGLEDFLSIKKNLANLGIPKEDLNAIQDRLEAGQTMSWSGFLKELGSLRSQAMESTVSLSDPDKRHLHSLFGKLGFGAEGSEQMVGRIERGDFSGVWEAVSGKLSTATPGALEQINGRELGALGRAMGLSPQATGRLERLVKGLAAGRMSQDSLANAMAHIKREAALAEQRVDANAEALGDEINRALKKAMANLEKREAADVRETKDVQQAEIRIKDAAARGDEAQTRRRPGRNLAAQARQAVSGGKGQHLPDSGAEANHVSTKPDATGHEAGMLGADKEAVNQQTVKGAAADVAKDFFHRNPDGAPADARDLGHLLAARAASAGHAGGKAGSDLMGKGGDAKDQAFKQFTAKLSAEGPLGAGLAQTGQQAEKAFDAAMAKTGQGGAQRQEVLRQVESGMLRSLKNGGKQITLKLNPESLGKVTVMLQVHNKEVRAVIRTENDEVTKSVNDQVHQLRTALEQQGLKVDKLEVQTQLKDDYAAQDWNGHDQHNKAREHEEMARHMRQSARLRAAARQERELSAAQPLAQEMHFSPSRETISASGLDIIA